MNQEELHAILMRLMIIAKMHDDGGREGGREGQVS